jgi:hypothetical protein
MRYLIDGYNVTMADPATCRLDRDSMRLSLVRRLAARARELLGAGPVTIVFDGGVLREDEVHGNVSVRFSGDEIADDIIVRMAIAEHGDVVVVSADRELRSRVREHAGRSIDVRPVATIFEAAEPPPSTRRPPRRQVHGGLPSGHENITRELEDIWLPKEDE